MAKRRSTWVLGILAVVAFAATLIIAGAVWFFTAALERSPATGASAASRVRTMHILAWNPDRERLTHVTLPFWLIRLRPGSIRGGIAGSGIQVSIDADELESYGSTLVLDHTDDDGQRIVMWTE